MGRGKWRRKKAYVIDCLHLPKDVVNGMEEIYLIGNCEMQIRHFRGLLCYETGQIQLLAGKHPIIIQGECLQMEYFTFEEVRITGRICQISFQEASV